MENVIQYGRSREEYFVLGTDKARSPGMGLVIAAATPTQVLQVNAERLIACITNAGESPCFLSLSGSGCGNNLGIYLVASGGAFWFGRLTDFKWTGEIWAYSPLGTTLTWVES